MVSRRVFVNARLPTLGYRAVLHRERWGPVTWPQSELWGKWKLSVKAGSSAEAVIIINVS